MAQRTCDTDGCERPHSGRGLCSMHWKRTYGKRTKYQRTCATCATSYLSDRPTGRFCSDECKGRHYSETMRTRCALPADHPVMVHIAEADALAKAKRAALRAAASRSKFEWRTPRECPGCACWFTPLYTPNAICCSQRCSRRVHRWRRAAAERGARGSFTWSEFIHIARKFNYCCAYCGGKPERLDPDHVVPLSRGGSNTPSNLLPTCFMCNSSKNAMTPQEWEAWRAQRGLEPRATSWVLGDPRYAHLTEAVLAVA